MGKHTQYEAPGQLCEVSVEEVDSSLLERRWLLLFIHISSLHLLLLFIYNPRFLLPVHVQSCCPPPGFHHPSLWTPLTLPLPIQLLVLPRAEAWLLLFTWITFCLLVWC